MVKSWSANETGGSRPDPVKKPANAYFSWVDVDYMARKHSYPTIPLTLDRKEMPGTVTVSITDPKAPPLRTIDVLPIYGRLDQAAVSDGKTVGQLLEGLDLSYRSASGVGSVKIPVKIEAPLTHEGSLEFRAAVIDFFARKGIKIQNPRQFGTVAGQVPLFDGDAPFSFEFILNKEQPASNLGEQGAILKAALNEFYNEAVRANDRGVKPAGV